VKTKNALFYEKISRRNTNFLGESDYILKDQPKRQYYNLVIMARKQREIKRMRDLRAIHTN